MERQKAIAGRQRKTDMLGIDLDDPRQVGSCGWSMMDVC